MLDFQSARAPQSTLVPVVGDLGNDFIILLHDGGPDDPGAYLDGQFLRMESGCSSDSKWNVAILLRRRRGV
jgi:hypothetical protein